MQYWKSGKLTLNAGETVFVYKTCKIQLMSSLYSCIQAQNQTYNYCAKIDLLMHIQLWICKNVWLMIVAHYVMFGVHGMDYVTKNLYYDKF